MEILVRILFLLFLMVFGIEEQQTSTGGNAVPPSQGETFRSMTVIETVETLLLESNPVQIQLRVVGYQPDGCEYPVLVEQRREGNTVYVEIFRELPLAAACLAVIVPYEETIMLDGGFEPGSYTINVNGTIIEVTI